MPRVLRVLIAVSCLFIFTLAGGAVTGGLPTHGQHAALSVAALDCHPPQPAPVGTKSSAGCMMAMACCALLMTTDAGPADRPLPLRFSFAGKSLNLQGRTVSPPYEPPRTAA